MKLHLPKSLLTSLLTAMAVATTFSTTAWAGNWGDNGENGTAGSVYYVSATESQVKATEGDQASITELYLAQAVDGDSASGSKAATIDELILKSGDTMTIETHPWKDGSVNFSLLTIKNITIGDGTGSAIFNVDANQGVLINDVSGSITGSINGTLTLEGTEEKKLSITYSNVEAFTGSGTLVIGNNATVTVDRGDGGNEDAAIQTNIKILGGGTMNVTKKDAMGWGADGTYAALITLEGNESAKATLTIAGDQTMGSEFYLNGHAVINGTGAITPVKKNGIIINASGTDNTIEAGLLTRDSITLNVGDSSTLTVSGLVSLSTNLGIKGNDNYESSSIIKDGSGTVYFTNGNNVFGNKYYNIAGVTEINAAATFANGISVSGGQLKLGADIKLGKTIALSGGSLALGEGHVITIDADKLSGFDTTYHMVDETVNGFANDAYAIISGITDSNVSGTAIYKLGENEIQLQDGKYVTETLSQAYFVNVGDVQTDSDAVGGATRFFVYARDGQQTGNLIIKGDVGNLTAAQLLTQTEGNGNITVATDISLGAGATTQATGNLIIQNSTLSMVNARNSTYNLTSFNSVVLDNGTIEIKANAGTFKNVTVSEEGGQFLFNDIESLSRPYVLSGVTTLNGDLTLTTTKWRTATTIEQLTGTGDLIVNHSDTNSNSGDDTIINVSSLNKYSGNLVIEKNSTNAKTALNITLTANQDFGSVSLKGGAELTILSSEGSRTTNISKLTLENAGTLASTQNTNCHQGVFNIGEISQVGDNAVLTLRNGSQTSRTTVFNLNGGSVTGEIRLATNSATTGNRNISVNLNTAKVAENAVIVFEADNEKYYSHLGMSTDTKVAGLSGTTTNAANVYGYKIATSNTSDYVKDSGDTGTTPRDLEICVAEGKEYSTNANIDSTVNLVKSGEGKQIISGNVNSTSISVKAGELALLKENVSLNLLSLNVSAGTLSVGSETQLGTIVVQGNETTGGYAKLEASAVVNANLTLQSGSTLELAEGSTLNVTGAIENNGVLDISGKINWTLDSTDGLTVTYAESELGRTTNGLGAGVIHGLITGDGSLTYRGVREATYNGKAASLDTATGLVTTEGQVYYVMNTPTRGENSTELYYSMPNGQHILVDSVVTVGNHSYTSGPLPTEGVNSASAFYVGENGTLCIVGDSDKMTATEILTSTQGSGDVILRAPGYQADREAGGYETFSFEVVGKTQLTGDLYLAPYCISTDADNQAAVMAQSGAYLILQEGADISSFSSVNLSHSETRLVVNGEITKGENAAGHINNLTSLGAAATYLIINQGANNELVLSGDTTVCSYAHISSTEGNDGFEQPSFMNVEFNQSAQITIENLTSGDNAIEDRDASWLTIVSGYYGAYSHDNEINGVVNIESFDYLGTIYLVANVSGSLQVNLNLNEGQTLYDFQYFRNNTATGTQDLTITGEGTYVLSEGNSILSNFGIVSTDFAEDGSRVWTGTVEVNRYADGKVDFADYGNESSYVHFKGYKGTVSGDTANIMPNLILSNSPADEANDVAAMNAYEISGGTEGQVQTYKGSISGDGDFVVNAAENMSFNLEGDVSGWKDGAELKVTQGTQAVNFKGDATEINADVLATGGTMNATIDNAAAVAVNGVVKADGGTLNLSVNTAQGTTFAKEVNVTKLAVGADSTAKLEAASTAGNIKIGSYGEGEVASLSNGLTVADNVVSGGYIADAMISHIQQNGTVQLTEVTASNLYLYGGSAVEFQSTDTKNQFTFDKQTSYGNERVNEVVFTSDIFSGMVLSEDGAQLTLTVDDAVAWGDAAEADWTNVTIKLNGFTIEKLADTAGVWDWETFGLSISATTQAEVAMLAEAGLDTITAKGLLTADYDFVEYVQNGDGLVIRMYNTPEPTTATLSLLALAALAARRRRRK